MQVLTHDLCDRSGIRRATGKHVIECRSERVDVGANINVPLRRRKLSSPKVPIKSQNDGNDTPGETYRRVTLAALESHLVENPSNEWKPVTTDPGIFRER
jgi:hypothetical protein